MAEAEGTRDVRIVDEVFSALAHPARRQILLSVHFRGTCTAGDIARRFECSWPTTSRHLATLVDAGLLSVVKEGRTRRYSSRADVLRDTLTTWAGYFTDG